MRLAYQAYDKTGRLISDTVEAGDVGEATEQLRRQGLYVTWIDAGTGSAPRASRAALFSADHLTAAFATLRRLCGTKRRLNNLSMFTRQLHVLCATGTPLVEALEALERQAREAAWRNVIADVRQRVEEGAPLSEAMTAHQHTFDPIYCSLIAAGESGGDFGQMLERIGRLISRQLQVHTHVTGALVYPLLLLMVACVVLALMLVFVLPRFTGLFDTLDVPLPPSTQMLTIASEGVRGYWWGVLAGVIIGGGGVYWWLTTPQGRYVRDTALLRIPCISTLTRSFITARLCRLMGTLLIGHVSMLEVLNLTRAAAGNEHYRRLIDQAEEAVTRGEPISDAFNDDDLVSPMVHEAMRSGEATGQIGPQLLNIADFLDENNEVVIKSLSSILEPVILIGLGVLVGLMALAMFLPLFDLTASAGG